MSFTICENWQVLHTVGFALTSLVCSRFFYLCVCVFEWVSAFRIGLFTFFGCCFVCVGTILCVKNLGIFSREREAEENLSLHCIPQFFCFTQRRNKVVVSRGARWGRSLLARWWFWDEPLFWMWVLFVWVSVYGCCLGDGDFYQEEKVCVCVCFFQCSFSLLRVQ